jgi:hypothetical protein
MSGDDKLYRNTPLGPHRTAEENTPEIQQLDVWDAEVMAEQGADEGLGYRLGESPH